MMRVIRSRGHEGRSKGCPSVLRARARARIMSQTTVSALLRRLFSGVSDMKQRFCPMIITMMLLSVICVCKSEVEKTYIYMLLVIVVVHTVIVIKYFSCELFIFYFFLFKIFFFFSNQS